MTTSWVLPIDGVTLHRWDWTKPDDWTGDQIGALRAVDGPGTVTFPAHAGDRADVRVVAWHEGTAIWLSAPLIVTNGDTVSLTVPIEAVLSQ
jgi:hypothetical protein